MLLASPVIGIFFVSGVFGKLKTEAGELVVLSERIW